MIMRVKSVQKSKFTIESLEYIDSLISNNMFPAGSTCTSIARVILSAIVHNCTNSLVLSSALEMNADVVKAYLWRAKMHGIFTHWEELFSTDGRLLATLENELSLIMFTLVISGCFERSGNTIEPKFRHMGNNKRLYWANLRLMREYFKLGSSVEAVDAFKTCRHLMPTSIYPSQNNED